MMGGRIRPALAANRGQDHRPAIRLVLPHDRVTRLRHDISDLLMSDLIG